MKYLEFEHDKKTIRGFLHGENAEDVVLLMHGFMGNKVDHHFMMKTFAQDIAQEGFMSYRFDFLGCGDSDGEFFEEESIDAVNVDGADGNAPFYLVGFKITQTAVPV